MKSLLFAAAAALALALAGCRQADVPDTFANHPDKVVVFYLDGPEFKDGPRAELRAQSIKYFTDRPLTICRIENAATIEDNVYPTGDIKNKPGKVVVVSGDAIGHVYRCPTQRA